MQGLCPRFGIPRKSEGLHGDNALDMTYIFATAKPTRIVRMEKDLTNGKKGGNPIVLLSPLPESILAFLPTWDMFSARGPVIAVDLPTFGLSEGRPDLRAPEPLGDFLLRILEAFGLEQPHVVAPDVGTPACLFAAANHPGIFKSLVIGSGATDHTDIGGILDQIVNAPSLEPFKNLTGEQFVRGAIENMKQYNSPTSHCGTIWLPTPDRVSLRRWLLFAITHSRLHA